MCRTWVVQTCVTTTLAHAYAVVRTHDGSPIRSTVTLHSRTSCVLSTNTLSQLVLVRTSQQPSSCSTPRKWRASQSPGEPPPVPPGSHDDNANSVSISHPSNPSRKPLIPNNADSQTTEDDIIRSTPPQDGSCPFMRLPTELRLAIVEHILEDFFSKLARKAQPPHLILPERLPAKFQAMRILMNLLGVDRTFRVESLDVGTRLARGSVEAVEGLDHRSWNGNGNFRHRYRRARNRLGEIVEMLRLVAEWEDDRRRQDVMIREMEEGDVD